MRTPDHGLRTLLFSLGCATLLVFCVSAPPARAQDKAQQALGPDAPQWMFDLNDAYPEADFLAVIGEGDSRREAEADAAGALSKIFISKIDSETTASMRYRELDRGGSGDAVIERSVDKRVTVASAQDLINVQFSDVYTDKLGLVHIVGFLNRKATARIYLQKISQNADRVTGFLEDMEEAEDAIHRYACIDAAVLFARANELLLEQLTIISPAARKTVDLPYDLNALARKYAEVAGKMVFLVKVRNDSDDKIAKITAYLLGRKGFTVSRGAAALGIDGEVLIEDTKMNNKYANVRWTLSLEMKDERGRAIVTFQKNQRESAISRPEAVARSYREMEKQIRDEFLGQFEEYLNGIILK